MRLKRHAEQLTLWPEESPANLPRWQDDGKDLLTCDGSGLSSSASCARLLPVGSWQRTLSESLALSLTGSAGSAMSLRLRATKSGRSLLVPAMSEPLTDETACGSWPTVHGMDNEGNPRRNGPTGNGRAVTRAEWPTATAVPYGNNRGGGEGRMGPVRPSLEGAARLWPTATGEDSRASGSAGYSTESGRHPGTTLTDAANRLWASPQARDSRLGAMTPEGHARRMEHQRGLSLPEQIDRAGLLDQGSLSTSGKRRDWPTAQARDDHGPRMGHTKGGRDLPTEAGATGRGSLNPDWVAQLLGFPDGWLCPPSTLSDEWLFPATAAQLSGRSGTASSHRSRK